MNIFEIFFYDHTSQDEVEEALAFFGFQRFYVSPIEPEDAEGFPSAFVITFDEHATTDNVDSALRDFGSFFVEAKED